ncbi:MAG: hypothetical protein MZV64_69895 [Ignavibacteriales bacterium]|nr:hypothetical protein [Ignavibacteriales bacterium]
MASFCVEKFSTKGLEDLSYLQIQDRFREFRKIIHVSMKPTDYFSIKILRNEKLIFLDQTKLPLEEIYVQTDNYERIAEAIERLEIRGAPLIGIAAAYALALSLKNIQSDTEKVFNSSLRTDLLEQDQLQLIYFKLLMN